MVARGEGGEGIGRDNWWLQNSHWDVGNTVSSVGIAMYSAKWVLEIFGGTLCKVHNCLTTVLYP